MDRHNWRQHVYLEDSERAMRLTFRICQRDNSTTAVGEVCVTDVPSPPQGRGPVTDSHGLLRSQISVRLYFIEDALASYECKHTIVTQVRLVRVHERDSRHARTRTLCQRSLSARHGPHNSGSALVAADCSSYDGYDSRSRLSSQSLI